MKTEKRTEECNREREERETGKEKDREETETKRGKTCGDAVGEEDEENEERTEKKGKRGKRKSEVVIPDDGVPYDRGWGWMIVLAGFINLVLIAGYNRGTFIFFVNFLEEFRAPVTETALLFGVKAGINSVVGLFIMNAVVGRFGVRRTVMIGGVCLSLSAILGSLAWNVTSLILFQAVFHGLGMAMLGMPITVLLGFYFRRRRSLAMSIMKCGVGAGAVAFPPIVTYLLNQYGLRGALLIMGGINLNTIVVAALLRPTSFYKKLKLRHGGESEKATENGMINDSNDTECGEKLLGDGDKDCEKATEKDSSGTECTEELLNRDKTARDTNAADCTRKLLNGAPSDRNSAVKTTKNGTVKDTSTLNGQTAQNNTKDPHAHKNIFSNATDIPVWTKDAHAHKNISFSNITDGPIREDHAPVRENGSSVIVIEEDGHPLTVRGRGGEKRTFVVHHTDGVTMLSRSTPELHFETTFRPRTFSVNDKYYSFKPLSPGGTGSVLDALNRSHLARYLSRADLEHDTPCITRPTDQASEADDKNAVKKRTCLQQTWRLLKKIFGVLDFSLFHSPMFRLLVVFFVMSPMLGAVATYLPAMAKERGLDENQRAVLLSIIGGLDFCCRLLCGFIADTRIVKVSTMIGVAYTILGVMCQLTRLLTSFSLLAIFAVVHGILGGVAACVMPILIMEDIGLENTAKALGFNKLFSGAAMAGFHPLLGYIRDATGSYDAAYNVIGAFTLVSAVSIVCIRFLPHTLPTDPDPDENESSPLNHETQRTAEKKSTS